MHSSSKLSAESHHVMPSFATDMENSHFGDGAGYHGEADEYPLDFGDMLQTVDGPLHHHIYEFFQPGPAVVRQVHQLGHRTLQESTFPNFPPSLSAALEFPQVSTFRTSTDFPPQSADHIQFNAAGTDGLPTPMDRPTFHYAPEKASSMVHATHEIVTTPVRGYDLASYSPNTVKAAPSHTHRGIKSFKGTDHRGLVKTKRPADQADHILRERIRRDDMTSKFRMLESLIPPGPKRDRATIVEDSIQYLKNLHHRLKGLEQKRSEMKSISTMKKSCSRPGNTIHTDNNNTVSSPNDKAADAGSIEKMEVHLDLPHEVVIEMTCRSHEHIQSQILRALERLRMDILRCSISKLHDRVVCVIVVKPEDVLGDPPNISSDVVIRALKRAVDAGS